MDRVIYSAKFGDKTIRFVVIKMELYVSRTDIVEIFRECAADYVKLEVNGLVDDWLKGMADAQDRKSAMLGESSIGPVVHFYTISHLLHTMSDFNESRNDELIALGRRINALFRWFSDASYQAHEHFGITIFEMLNSVSKRLDRLNDFFVVNVIHEGDVWVAECDELGLVTEAKTYDELTEQVWEIASELYELYELVGDSEYIRIKFVQEQSSDSRIAL
ncbi:DUF1902 domain-containing protein [Xenorhabdus bovienii]|uniref:DUF1902 domain-containing protein n=1 Tax=Xenorhabdus bovienii str. kraussei Becker Underwood TaxID=1398204 RepID=A0A077PZC7_XENBV|nr:DUF1902 domain-containing protein [Xenorhabdus bovienii]CDH26096.1 conserved hypothetical protein [Xenorhabdus bovienii str. kraussei Becker Underwood]